jgi:hypothetical protein
MASSIKSLYWSRASSSSLLTNHSWAFSILQLYGSLLFVYLAHCHLWLCWNTMRLLFGRHLHSHTVSPCCQYCKLLYILHAMGCPPHSIAVCKITCLTFRCGALVAATIFVKFRWLCSLVCQCYGWHQSL